MREEYLFTKSNFQKDGINAIIRSLFLDRILIYKSIESFRTNT